MNLVEKEFTPRHEGTKNTERYRGLRIKERFKKFSFTLCLCISVCCILAFSSCDRIKEVYGKKGAVEASEAAAPVFAVNTSIIARGPIQDYIQLTGDIVSGSTVDTYSDAAGRVSEIFVTVGQRVNRGDRVASVDPSRPGMTFRNSIAAAPISGTVIAIPAQIGMTVSQAVPLARIAGGGGLEIRLHVAERFISKMAMNLLCDITLDAWPGEVFHGSVSELSPTVDAASRTMEVKVNVDNPGSKLKAGMFAKVRVITEQKDNIVKIPVSAVVNRFGETYVFVVDNSNSENPVVRKRIIVQGILIDGVLEVSEGLAPGEEIVIRGMSLLEDGSRVNIIERLSPLSQPGAGANQEKL
uniref:Putative Co/Zn/Cd efflux system membrane fusion protein n=1 Tax=uncultured bacterium contig00011 TaxID=1181503 RepID=A0A806KIF8_9BACT|nr:putative Co/Zn/Cd efflux system membrane fusion protein [uncultured bacterium contig00011]